jgi:hypothetical protein
MNASLASCHTAAGSICLPPVGAGTWTVESRSEAQRLDPNLKKSFEHLAAKLQSQPGESNTI